MVYFASDLHFGHKNIIKLCNRPFKSVEEMDQALVNNWNTRVKKSDTVYITGDVFWNMTVASRFIPLLNGKKTLICGNHDSWAKHPELVGNFEKFADMLDQRIDGRQLTLCHYPMLEWRGSDKFGSDKLGYLIYGHIHNNYSDDYLPLLTKPNALNAGAEINGYMPVTFDELRENNEKHVLSVLKNPDEKALYLARKYHAYQIDKAGAAYVNHVETVASGFEDRTLRAVALMHDIFEDTDIPREIVEKNFSPEIYEALTAITKAEGEDYFDYIRRVGKNAPARQVKLADLRHNMDITRLHNVTERDLERVEKYKKAYSILM